MNVYTLQRRYMQFGTTLSLPFCEFPTRTGTPFRAKVIRNTPPCADSLFVRWWRVGFPPLLSLKNSSARVTLVWQSQISGFSGSLKLVSVTQRAFTNRTHFVCIDLTKKTKGPFKPKAFFARVVGVGSLQTRSWLVATQRCSSLNVPELLETRFLKIS